MPLKTMLMALACAAAGILAVPAQGQTPSAGSPAAGVPQDRSHRHLIFSRPATLAQDGQLAAEPRYWLQGDTAHARGPADNSSLASTPSPRASQEKPKPSRSLIRRDWAMSFPSTSAVGTVGAGQFPAKYVFDVNAAPSCANDFVVFNTGLPQVVPVAASRTGTFTTTGPNDGQTATLGGTLVLTASGPTPGSATITIAANYCAQPGQGVTIGGVSLTSNATVDVWTVTVATPNVNDTVSIGGVTYTFVASGTGVLGTANQIHLGGSNAATAKNLYAALTGVPGNCSTANCFGTGTVVNPKGTATYTAGNAFVTVTANCAGGTPFALAVTDTGAGRITPSNTTPGANGTTSGTNFALNSAVNTLANNIQTAVNNNPATGATATSPTNTVVLSGANGVTLAQNFTAGLTLSGSTLTGGVPGTNTGLFFAIDGTAATAATNLAAAINRNGAGPGVSATVGGAVVTVTATTPGAAGNSITLVDNLSRFSWAGGTLTGGVNGVPALVAYNQMYSTQGSVGGLCNQNGPSVMWSYQTAAVGTGSAATSPILSLDGSKVAYVETKASGAILHVLKWKAGQGTTVAAAPAPDQTLAPGAAWSSCTAGNSCVANVPFNGNPQSTRSAPYYDYTTDSLYVGDNSGRLHKFTGVFDGTPAEVTTGWPITVHSGAFILTGPVYDSTSGNIFVGDSGGQLSYVRESGSTVGACASGSPPCLGSIVQALGGAIVDAPIVDGTTGRVLAFEGTDTTTRGAVFQFDTALTSGSQRRVSIGSGTTGSGFDQSYIYSGTFDEAYYDSADGTGRLLVCGKTPQGNSRYDSPALHRITFTAGIMNTVSDGFLTLTNLSGEECSPVTQIMNGSTEWLFFSVGDNGGFVNGAADCPVGTPNGCIMSLNYSALAGTWPPTAVSAAVPVPAGPIDAVTGTNKSSTSGIVVDNVSSAAQASSVYFSYTNSAVAAARCNGATGGGCVVKLTQSGLQ